MNVRSRSKIVRVNGTDLHYVEAGAGEPLLLVHGSLSDFRNWGLQKKFFSKNYRVIAYSRRYHYPNLPPDDVSAYSVDLHAEDLAGFMQALGCRPAHLIGSSYGAYVSLATAVRHPELVRSVVLGEPPVLSLLRHDFEGSRLLSDFLSRVWEPARRAFESDDFELGVKSFYEGVTSRGLYQKLSDSVRARLFQNAEAMKAEIISSGCFPSLHTTNFQEINAPSLLVTGELSPSLFVRINDILAMLLPNAKQALIPAASHNMHSDNAKAYNDCVMKFLSSHGKLARQV